MKVKPKKIRGTFCERTINNKTMFNRNSFRWKKSGRSWLLVGCQKRKWTKGRCRNGMKAHKLLLRSSHRARCKLGAHRLTKR